MLNQARPSVLRTPFAIALITSLVILFTPESGVPSAPAGTDKVVHLLLFAALGGTGLIARVPAKPLLIGLGCYAGISELLQGVLPIGREGDLVDAAVDVLGSLAGWGLVRALVNRRTSRR